MLDYNTYRSNSSNSDGVNNELYLDLLFARLKQNYHIDIELRPNLNYRLQIEGNRKCYLIF
jgi:hypothetical protein